MLRFWQTNPNMTIHAMRRRDAEPRVTSVPACLQTPHKSAAGLSREQENGQTERAAPEGRTCRARTCPPATGVTAWSRTGGAGRRWRDVKGED